MLLRNQSDYVLLDSPWERCGGVVEVRFGVRRSSCLVTCIPYTRYAAKVVGIRTTSRVLDPGTNKEIGILNVDFSRMPYFSSVKSMVIILGMCTVLLSL